MPRYIDGTTQSELDLRYVGMALLCQITLTSGVLYVWSGYGDLAWNGNTYLGMGKLAKVGTVQEDSGVVAQGMSIGLEGVSSDDLSDALADVTQGQPANLYVVLLDANRNIIGTPIASYAGLTDAVSVSQDPDGNCGVSIALENRLTQLQRNREYRWTNAQMQELYPAEQGFIYTANLQNYIALWGDTSF